MRFEKRVVSMIRCKDQRLVAAENERPVRSQDVQSTRLVSTVKQKQQQHKHKQHVQSTKLVSAKTTTQTECVA